MPIYGGVFAPTHGQTLGTVIITGVAQALQIIKLDWTGISREAIDCTNMLVQPTTGSGFGNTIRLPSAYVSPGDLRLQVLHNPTQAIPITDPSKTGPTMIAIRMGPAASAQELFTGYGWVSKYEIDGPLDGKAETATVEIVMTDTSALNAAGAVAWTTAT